MGTGLLLGVLSIISVLLALAVWLWGTASNREQRQCAISDGGEPLTSSAVGESARRTRHARASKA